MPLVGEMVIHDGCWRPEGEVMPSVRNTMGAEGEVWPSVVPPGRQIENGRNKNSEKRDGINCIFGLKQFEVKPSLK